MKILSLQMENFMPYQKPAKIDFTVPEAARVLLVQGHNGAGKTSVFHAIRWCLYGFTKKGDQKIGTELLFNGASRPAALSNPDIKMSVSFVWENEGKKYELVRRAWFPSGQPTLTTSQVLRVDDGDAYAVTAIDAVVRRFLPEEISHLFLFDGESLQAFQNMNSDGNSAAFIKNQIENTLSIPCLKEAKKFLEKRRNDESLSVAKDQAAGSKLKTLQNKLVEKQKTLEAVQAEIAKAKIRISEENAKIDAAEEALGNVQEFISISEALKSARDQLTSNNESVELFQDNARSILGSSPWLPAESLLRSVLDEAQTEAKQDQELDQNIGALKAKIQMLEDSKGSKTCPLCKSVQERDTAEDAEQIHAFEEELKLLEQAPRSSASAKLQRVFSTGLNQNSRTALVNAVEQLNIAKGSLALQRQKILDLENSLAGYKSGGADTDKILEDFKQATKYRDYWKLTLNEKTDQESAIHNEITSVQNEIKKIGNISPQKQVTLNCYSQLQDIFTQALQDYVVETRKSVEEKASQTFTQILSGEEFEGVAISETYGARALKNGAPAQIISQGQETALSVALLDGLIRTAMPGGDGFVLMDSPTGSLDEPNRKNFFSWAGASAMRVSVFVHSGEYDDQKDRKYFGNNIGRAYEVKLVGTNISEIMEVA